MANLNQNEPDDMKKKALENLGLLLTLLILLAVKKMFNL